MPALAEPKTKPASLPPRVSRNAAKPERPNAAQWWEALGRVPLERIVMNPPPGTATPEDVTRLDDHEDRLCELIDGTLVEKTVSFIESYLAARLITVLNTFVIPRDLGIVTGADGMMRLLGRQVRIPDIAFTSWDRLPGRRLPDAAIPDLVPDLAVEVLSKSNTKREMDRKRREYFEAGVRLIWYVDPKTRTARAYTGVEAVQEIDMEGELTGGDVLPGFRVRLGEVFVNE